MFATSATVLESMPYCHEVLVERYLGSLIPEYGKIDNDYKSFNTRTIRSSPANRGTSCMGRVCGFLFAYIVSGSSGHSISGAVVVLTRFSNTRYFSGFQQQGFFLRCDFQIYSILKWRNMLTGYLHQAVFVSSASRIRNSFSASVSFTELCRSTSDIPLPATTG